MANGFWLTVGEMPTSVKQYVFTKKFNASQGATFTADISADGRYVLLLNGEFVCEGPCQGSQYVHYFESADLTPYLRAGENILEIKLMYLPCGSSIYINSYRHGSPAIWFDGKLTENGNTTVIGSDNSFSCVRIDSVRYRNPEAGQLPSMPPMEDWQSKEIKTFVRPYITYTPTMREYEVYGHLEHYPLYKRPIPLLRPEQEKAFAVLNTDKSSVELAPDRYVTAFVSFALKGKKGSRVKITYTECFRDENGKKKRRDATSGTVLGPTDTIVMNGKEQVITPFFFRSFRYIRIEAEDGSKLELKNATYREYYYPLNITGSFECSDKQMNDMWETSIHTLLCCTHELFVDCPYYEQQQYDQDGYLEMLYSLCLSNDTAMAGKIITEFAHSQRPDGYLQANYPSCDVQMIPDFPLYWVFMLREHLKRTGDTAFARSMYGTLLKLLDAYDSNLTEKGLVGRTPFWQFIDWVPGWEYGVPHFGKNEPLTFDSLLYAAALGAAADLSDELGKTRIGDEFRARKENVINAVNAECFDSSAGMYRDIASEATYSRHTAVWAVLSGAKTGDEAKALLEKSFADGIAKCSFSMNHFMFRALEATGLYGDRAAEIFEGWRKMLDDGCTTWCENPDDPRSECHGWSGAPIFEFSSVALGVNPTKKGYAGVTVAPDFDFCGLEYAKGTVPTPYGDVSVAWEKKDGRIHFTASTPDAENMPLTVVLPDGTTVPVEGESYEATL